VTLATQTESARTFKTHGVLLSLRMATFAFVASITCISNFAFFIVISIVIAATSLLMIKIDRLCWLSYCFLAATTMWAGVAATLIITGHDGITIAFLLCLIFLDSSEFIMTLGRRWK
jgi:hypothetical protein